MPVFSKSQYYEELPEFPSVLDLSHWRKLGRSIGHNYSARTVLSHLVDKFKFLSSDQWQHRIELGHVLLGEEVVSDPQLLLGVGRQIAMYFPIHWEPPGEYSIEKIFEKEDVGVFFKPSGIPMHENGPYYRKNFASLLKARHGDEWAAMHRLDKETSGVVVCGRTKESRKKISTLFLENKMKKVYRCLVSEVLPLQQQWTCTAPIGKPASSLIRIKKWVEEGGESARTDFRVLGEVYLPKLNKTVFEVEARPKTGRTNQIRVHLASAGMTILGDKLYHPDEQVFLQYLEEGDTEEVIAKTGFARLALHAHTIGWECEDSGEPVIVTQPIDWQETSQLSF